MKGYLMQERSFVKGEDNFVESFSPENKFGVVFEDDGETGYFYAVEKDAEGQGLRVLDALHIYEVDDEDIEANGGDPVGPGDAGNSVDGRKSSKLMLVWSTDWNKCALVIDGFCHAIYDFVAQGGYNINEFPPPNAIWTKGERQLTDELVRSIF
jgi:hypothetical protein